MRQWLDKYYGLFRKVKFNYVLLNLINQRKLDHARRMYKKYGIDRSVLLPISSEHLPPGDEGRPWTAAPDAKEQMERRLKSSDLPEPIKSAITDWPDKGYVILKHCFSDNEVIAINEEIERLIKERSVDFNFTGRKIMFAYKHSQLLRKVVHEKRITDVLDFLHGMPMRPFQSINFLTGSEQAAHSDSIHMTTYPLGYLAAAWIALEPMTTDNGPLIYYPGSHKLPYLLNSHYDHGGTALTIGKDAYLRYEQAVAQAIQEHDLQGQEFHADPGDVLIWHANLVHGGKKMSVPDASRKSMAIHYFAKDVLCYHELTQRVAHIEELPSA